MLKRPPKWYRADDPRYPRCPVITRTRVGPHQCEMTEAHPHRHDGQ